MQVECVSKLIMEKHKALKHKEKIHVNKVLVKRKNKGHKEEQHVTKFFANRKMEEGIPKTSIEIPRRKKIRNNKIILKVEQVKQN